MFCGNCGNKLKKGATFCGKCGKEVNKNTEIKIDTQEKIKIIEIEEKEKQVESLTSNGLIYTVVALTMILSFGFIIVCSLI